MFVVSRKKTCHVEIRVEGEPLDDEVLERVIWRETFAEVVALLSFEELVVADLRVRELNDVEAQGLNPPDADGWYLELGDVRESARVWVNGEPAGVAVAHPFRVECPGIHPDIGRVQDFRRRIREGRPSKLLRFRIFALVAPCL